MTYFVRKGNKYNNTKQLYNGNRYDSKKEATFAQQLDLRVKAKDIKSYERQVKIDLRVKGEHVCNYYIDFVVTNNDGSKEYIEVKGIPLPLWQIKWRLLEILIDDIEPGAELIVVK